MEKTLASAIHSGRVSDTERLLRDNPTLDVNWSGFGSPLHLASWQGYDTIVAILLAHPDIDVNNKNTNGSTPLSLACFEGKISCVSLMLKDPRVLVNECDYEESTPLYWVAYYGHVEICKLWIASGREMDLGEPGNENTDVIGQCYHAQEWLSLQQHHRKQEVATLLERFQENPGETRHALRVELGFKDELAAEVFALVVFASDGQLEIKHHDAPSTPAARFFKIATRLPLELQMVLCYRVVGSMKDIIHRKDSEVAFKHLAKRTLPSSRPPPQERFTTHP